MIAARRPEYGRNVIYDAISHIRVRSGDDAAQLILDEARTVSADLILLGTSGTSVLKGLLFGSVAQAVTAKTSVPVLLVPVPA